MPYIDKDYYDAKYIGVSIDVETFYRLVNKSSNTIDILTNYKLLGVEFESLPIFIKDHVKKATAAQVEYLYTAGEDKAIGSGSFGQVKAGNFSYGDKAGKESTSRSQSMTSQLVISLLEATGLLYKGIDVR